MSFILLITLCFFQSWGGGATVVGRSLNMGLALEKGPAVFHRAWMRWRLRYSRFENMITKLIQRNDYNKIKDIYVSLYTITAILPAWPGAAYLCVCCKCSWSSELTEWARKRKIQMTPSASHAVKASWDYSENRIHRSWFSKFQKRDCLGCEILERGCVRVSGPYPKHAQ